MFIPQIVQLYVHGYDSYAEELLETVVDEQALGNSLLKIAAKRLTIFTKVNPAIWCQVAAVGPLLTEYLDGLVSVIVLHTSNKYSTIIILLSDFIRQP
jgi:hypothetical protein